MIVPLENYIHIIDRTIGHVISVPHHCQQADLNTAFLLKIDSEIHVESDLHDF